MSVLFETGKWHPCRTEGVEIPVDDDQALAEPGDIIEFWLELDKDFDKYTLSQAVFELSKMKDDYPYIVFHYIKVEPRRITVQCSGAPVEGGNPGLWAIIGMFAVIALIIIAVIKVAEIAVVRIWKLVTAPPAGAISVTAKDMKTLELIPNVTVTVAGETRTTGSFGQAAYFPDVPVGTCQVVGETLSGYQAPDPVNVIVNKDVNVPAEIQYYHEDQQKPDYGYLKVDTTPVTGKVIINGEDYGLAPVGPIQLPWGTYTISYSEVKDWVRPVTGQVTLKRGDEVTLVTGTYTKLRDWDPWPWLRPVLIGGGLLAGAAIMVPLIRDARRRS